MKVKPGPSIKWITVALFVLCSGSQFGIDNARYIDVILLGLSIVAFFMTKKRALTKRNASIALYFLLIMWANYLVYLFNAPNINAYISYSLRLISALLIAGCFDFDCYEYRLTMLTVIIAVISLYAYVVRLISPGDLRYTVIFGLFRTANVNGTIRNAGIFWEPGAYQLFLNLALFYLLRKNNFKFFGKNIPKVRVLALAVLVLAIISTMSTTGYVLLLVSALTLYSANFKSMGDKNKIIVAIPLFLLLVYLVTLIVGSDTVAGKFIGTGNVASTNMRLNDILGSLRIILENPLGLGHGTSRYFDTISKFLIVHNSSGILTAMCYFGVLYGIPFLVFVFIFAKENIDHYWLTYAAIVILTGFNENFYFYPIYFVLLFDFQKANRPQNEVVR